jgi:hypothetical protein
VESTARTCDKLGAILNTIAKHLIWVRQCMFDNGMCPDGGTCHHSCKDQSPKECFRMGGCVPLTGSALSDSWQLHNIGTWPGITKAYNDVMQKLSTRLTSGNDVPVERTHITAEEFAILDAYDEATEALITDQGMEGTITDLWLDEFTDSTHCDLCGNSGIIDTRATAITSAGFHAGKLHWCICPNGRIYKKAYGENGPSEEFYLKRR